MTKEIIEGSVDCNNNEQEWEVYHSRNQKRHARDEKRFIRKQEQEISNISSVIPGANYIDNSDRRKDYKKYNPNQTSFLGRNNKNNEKKYRYRQNKKERNTNINKEKNSEERSKENNEDRICDSSLENSSPKITISEV